MVSSWTKEPSPHPAEDTANPVGNLAVGAALMANFAQGLADQLVLLQSAPEEKE